MRTLLPTTRVAIHPWLYLRRRYWAGWYVYCVQFGLGIHFGFGYIDVSWRSR